MTVRIEFPQISMDVRRKRKYVPIYTRLRREKITRKHLMKGSLLFWKQMKVLSGTKNKLKSIIRIVDKL